MFLNFVVKQSTIDLETICGLRLGIILLIERIFLGVALIVRRRTAVLVEEGRNAEEARRERVGMVFALRLKRENVRVRVACCH